MPKGVYRRTNKPVADRLWSKVDKTGECWLWTGTKSWFGHGSINADRTQGQPRRLQLTHRVAWEVTFGPIPEGLCVLHSCDTPACVNPKHLFLGTKSENSLDMVRKKRQAKGSQLPQTKLSPRDVLAIRSDPGTQESIAIKYDISQSQVSAIRNRKKWRWLE